MAVCSLGCGRKQAPHNQWGYCEVCAGNIGGWVAEVQAHPEHIDTYDDQLALRRERLRIARMKGKNSYANQLIEKRRRRKTA
jgi:hypothetical protein